MSTVTITREITDKQFRKLAQLVGTPTTAGSDCATALSLRRLA